MNLFFASNVGLSFVYGLDSVLGRRRSTMFWRLRWPPCLRIFLKYRWVWFKCWFYHVEFPGLCRYYENLTCTRYKKSSWTLYLCHPWWRYLICLPLEKTKTSSIVFQEKVGGETIIRVEIKEHWKNLFIRYLTIRNSFFNLKFCHTWYATWY